MLLLVVDDNADIGFLMGQIFESNGYQVDSVLSGAAALRYLRMHRPALVLLDLHMPGIDGMQVLRVLKNDPNLASIPVVVHTAMTTSAARAAAMKLGANAYLTKGCSIDDLVNTVAQFAA